MCENKNRIPEFIYQIDWDILKEQKKALILLVESNMLPLLNDSFQGIINLVDNVQDYAVDTVGLNESDVFDLEDPRSNEIDKDVWICPNCNSDNIEIKTWAKANSSEIVDKADFDDEDFFCADCESHNKPQLVKKNINDHIVGFQVTDQDGNVHPNLDPDAVYTIAQCRPNITPIMWRLKAIWNNTTPNPKLLMFSGDPRK